MNDLQKSIVVHAVVVIGWLILTFHLFTTPFRLEIQWTLCFIAILVANNYLWLWMLGFYLSVIKKEWEWLQYSIPKSKFKSKWPWYLVTLGEDGLCLVPLLYIENNVFTAGMFALLFTVLHRFNFPFWACLPKGTAFFIVALFILPKSGVVPLIIGHWLVDAFYLYKNSKISILYKYYYENGVLKEEGSHINSKREGLIKYYFPSGKIQQEAYYAKGNPEGLVKWYFENGNLEKEGTYKDGKIHGLYKWFNEDGSLASETNYEHDNMIGEPKHY